MGRILIALRDNPLFAREDRRLLRSWLIILIVYGAFWLPLNMGGRNYISEFLVNYFLPFAGMTVLLPLYFLEVVLRPDLFFALILGRWIAQQFCNPELLRDLRLTRLNSREIIHGILANYLILLCGFQFSAIYFIYHETLNESNLAVEFSANLTVDFNYPVLILAAVEDCTYAVAVLLIFVWEQVKSNLGVRGVIMALVKVILMTFPLMIITLLFETVLYSLFPDIFDTPVGDVAFHAFWFCISIPTELAIIAYCLWRIHRYIGKKWMEGDLDFG